MLSTVKVQVSGRNEAMKAEREAWPGARPYERTGQRRGYAKAGGVVGVGGTGVAVSGGGGGGGGGVSFGTHVWLGTSHS